MNKTPGKIVQGALLVIIAALLAGCSGNTAASNQDGGGANVSNSKIELTTFSTAPATIPPWTKMHDLNLGSSPWKLTSGMRRVASQHAMNDYEYTGSGSPVENEAATLAVPVKAGHTYVFSAWVDPSKISSGKFDLIIDSADGKSTYAFIFHPAGAASRYTTAAWTCPSGVDHVLLGMQLVRSAVVRGHKLKFSQPVLSEALLSNAVKRG